MFKKASKAQAKLRLSIDGVSGSGKTYTALKMASRIAAKQGGRIAVIDTEHGSASKYADLFDFDVVELEPPFDPRRYMKLMGDAAGEGYAVLVIDSLSHAWFGQGGLLDLVDEFAKSQAARTKSAPNTFSAWKDGTAIQNKLADTIIRSPMHIIATMRAKADYVQSQDKNGRTKIEKVGTAPIQKEGLEYEFDITISMDLDNNAAIVKTRCPALTGKVYAKPDNQLTDIVLDWLNAGAPAPVQTGPAASESTSEQDGENEGDLEFSMDDVTEDASGAASPALESYLHTLRKVFGQEHEKEAGKWFITNYTKAKSPDNIRTTHAEMSDDELMLMADVLAKHGARYAAMFGELQKATDSLWA